MQRQIPPYFFFFIIVLAFISSAIETDVYVPSFPDIKEALALPDNVIQSLISINFMGLVISALVCGPLSDSFGRRKVLSVGTGIFALASIACYLINDFTWLLLARFIQGIGAGSILTVAASTLFDRYDEKKSAQLSALLTTIIQGMMAIAPMIGSWLNIAFGWKSIFLFIALLTSITWLNIICFLPETLPHKERLPFKIQDIAKSFKGVLTDTNFMLLTLIRSLIFAPILIYTTSASILLVDYLQVPEAHFGFYQSATLAFYCLFAFMAACLISQFGEAVIRRMGYSIFVLGSVLLVMVSIFAAHSAKLICASMAVIGAGAGLCIGIYFAKAIHAQSHKGAAMSVTQALSMLYIAVSIEISRLAFDGSILSIGLVIAALAMLTLVCQGWLIICTNRNNVPINKI